MPDHVPVSILQDAFRRFFDTLKTSNDTSDIQIIKNPWYITYLTPAYVILGGAYLYWRITITMIWDFWLAWPLLIADIYTLAVTVIFITVSQKVVYPKYQPPLKGASIDILIPTYNEPFEIVEMTATAAQAVKGVNKVFILNDGNRLEIKNLAQRLGVEHVGRTENTHAKAGNMNNGLKYSTAEFVIFLDCDFVPQPNMIERLSGYFRDPNVAFVQTPQVFYNSKTSIQHRRSRFHSNWSEQSMFYEGIQPTKNQHNAVIFCGTNAMLRRKAIDSIGGMATGTATEDIHTALILQAQGWRGWYINEKLAFGIAPEDMKEYYRQRVRWGAGSLGLLFRSKDSPLRAKGMTFMQRLCYISSTSFFTSGLAKILYFIAPILTLTLGQNPVKIDFWQYWMVFIPFYSFSVLIALVYSRGSYHPLFTEQYNILNIFSNMASLKGVLKIQKKFGVSIKRKNIQEGKILYRGMVLMMSVMLLANWYAFFNWFYLKQGSVTGFVASDFGVAVFWNSINLFFVMSFLYFLKRFHEQGSQEYKFDSEGVRFFVHGVEHKLLDINLAGATVSIDSEKPYTQEFIMPFKYRNSWIPIQAVVESTTLKPNPGRLLFVRFKELTPYQRRVLIYYFFHNLLPKFFTTPQKNIIS